MSSQTLKLPHNLNIAINRLEAKELFNQARLLRIWFFKAYHDAEKKFLRFSSCVITIAYSTFLCGKSIAWLQKGGRPFGNAYKWIGNDIKQREDGQFMLFARRFFQGSCCAVNADPRSKEYGLRLTGGPVSIRGGMDRPIYSVPRS